MTSQISKLIKLSGAIAVAASVVGCSGGAYIETADRNDVVTVGDSVFDSNGVIESTLESYEGSTFRNYTTGGAEMAGGVIAPSVESQYSTANNTNGNIDTVLMNGGGNDILIPAMLFDPYGCRTHWWRWNISQSCINLIGDTYVAGVNLLNQMDADGVQNVVFLGYYEPPRSNSNLSQAVSVGDDYLSYACGVSTNANCTFVDVRGTVPASQIEGDDIHPTPAGSVNLANQVWPVLSPLL